MNPIEERHRNGLSIRAHTKSRKQFFAANDFRHGVRAEQEEDNDRSIAKVPSLKKAEHMADVLWEAD